MRKVLLIALSLLGTLVPKLAYAASCTACDAHVTVKDNFFVDFTTTNIPPTMTAPATLATAADNQVDHLFINNQYLEYIQEAANSDIVFTRDGTGVSWNGATVKGGWIIPNDQTDNEGIEISRGLTSGISRGLYTLGTDAVPGRALTASLTFAIPLTTDYDVILFGWRKVAAYCAGVTQSATGAAGPDCYTDIAAFNIDNGAIYTDTVLNGAGGAGLSAVDSTLTWADGEVHTLRVDISTARVVTWYLDNTVLTATQAGANSGFTFDASDQLMLLLVITRDATAAADTPPILLQLKYGTVN